MKSVKYKAKGFRLEVLRDGERCFTNIEARSEEELRRMLKRFSRITEVFSVEPHEWEDEYLSL